MSSPMEVFDCGKIIENVDIDEVVNYFAITNSETLHPFGSLKIKRNPETVYKKVSSEFIKFENINKKSIVLFGIIIRWYGCGTIFEINNGLTRQLIPDDSGGGTVK